MEFFTRKRCQGEDEEEIQLSNEPGPEGARPSQVEDGDPGGQYSPPNADDYRTDGDSFRIIDV